MPSVEHAARFTVSEAGWYQLRSSFHIERGQIKTDASEAWLLRLDDDGVVTDATLVDFRLGED